MGKFQIQAQHSLHEEGTKSYQVWKIGRDDAWVTVHQWGKAAAVPSGHGTGGEIKTLPFTRASMAVKDVSKVIREKSGRGYHDWRVPIDDMVDENDLGKMLRVYFGAARAELVLKNLDLEATTEEETFKEVKPKPAKEEKVDRGPEWGVW